MRPESQCGLTLKGEGILPLAKIILTVEDKEQEDGTTGMTVKWEGDTEDDGGPAFQYVMNFYEYILANAEHAEFVSEGDLPDPDTTLN